MNTFDPGCVSDRLAVVSAVLGACRGSKVLRPVVRPDAVRVIHLLGPEPIDHREDDAMSPELFPVNLHLHVTLVVKVAGNAADPDAITRGDSPAQHARFGVQIKDRA